jgi:hypothetical protein
VSHRRRARLEFEYGAHLQRFLTFVVLWASGFIGLVQLSQAAAGSHHWTRQWDTFVLGTWIAAGVSLWGLAASSGEFYLIARLEEELGVLQSDLREARMAPFLPRLGIKGRAWMNRNATGSGNFSLIEAIALFAFLGIEIALVYAAIGNWQP